MNMPSILKWESFQYSTSIQYREITSPKVSGFEPHFPLNLYFIVLLQKIHFFRFWWESLILFLSLQVVQKDVILKQKHSLTRYCKGCSQRSHKVSSHKLLTCKTSEWSRDPALAPHLPSTPIQAVHPDTYHWLWLLSKRGHPRKWRSGTRSGPGRREAGSKNASCTGNSLRGGSPSFSSAWEKRKEYIEPKVAFYNDYKNCLTLREQTIAVGSYLQPWKCTPPLAQWP